MAGDASEAAPAMRSPEPQRSAQLAEAVARSKMSNPSATARQVFEQLVSDPAWAAEELALSEVKRACSKLAKASQSPELENSVHAASRTRTPRVEAGTSTKHVLVDATTSPSKLAALLARAGSASSAAALITTLLEWTTDTNQNVALGKLAEFVAAGGVEHVVHSLERFQGEAGIARGALGALSAVVFNAPVLRAANSKALAFQAGAAAAVVGAMASHHGSSHVLVSACHAISALTSDSGEEAEACDKPLVDAGVYGALLRAMEEHPDDTELLMEAIRAISNLTKGGAAPADVLVRVGGAMRAHSGNAVLLCKGLLALANNMGSLRGDFHADAARAGVAVAVQAVSDHVQSLELCTKACMLFCNMLVAGFGDEVGSAGVKAAARRCSAAHPRDLQLQEMVSQILRLLKMHRTGELAEATAKVNRARADEGLLPATERAVWSHERTQVVSTLATAEEEEDCTPLTRPQVLSGQRVQISDYSEELTGLIGVVEGVSRFINSQHVETESLVLKLDDERTVTVPAACVQPICTPASVAEPDIERTHQLMSNRLSKGREVTVALDLALPECRFSFHLLDRCCSECGLPPQDGTARWNVCAQCRVTRYCCAAHQRAAWKRGGHKHTCGRPLPTAESLAKAAEEEPSHVLAALREFGQACPPLAVCCCVHLMQLTITADGLPDTKSALANLLATNQAHTEALVGAMRAFPDLEGVQLAAIPLLSNYFCFARKQVLSAGGVEAIVVGLDRVQTESVALAALSGLMNMVRHEDPLRDVKRALVEARGVAVVCAAMQKYPQNEGIVQEGASLLFFAAANDQRGKSQCVSHGAPAILAAALAAFGGSECVAEHAIGAVRNITAGETDACLPRKRACVRAGLLSAVLQAMRVHRHKEDIQEMCLSALVNLASDEAYQAVEKMPGGHAALLVSVVAVTRAFASSEGMVFAFGLSAISMYTKDKELARTAMRVGAVDVLALALAPSKRAVLGPDQIAGMLLDLLRSDLEGADTRAAFRKAGVPAALLKLLRRQPSCDLAKTLFLQWLAPFQEDERAAELSAACRASGMTEREFGDLVQRIFDAAP